MCVARICLTAAAGRMRRKLMSIKELKLDEHHRMHMEEVVERETGVMKARFNDQRHHLMIVAYDPKRINSAMILNHIKQQKVNAQLVGGI
jgi:hypothetical protein